MADDRKFPGCSFWIISGLLAGSAGFVLAVSRDPRIVSSVICAAPAAFWALLVLWIAPPEARLARIFKFWFLPVVTLLLIAEAVLPGGGVGIAGFVHWLMFGGHG